MQKEEGSKWDSSFSRIEINEVEVIGSDNVKGQRHELSSAARVERTRLDDAPGKWVRGVKCKV